jgi:alpha-methylacyl-CoA racemase
VLWMLSLYVDEYLATGEVPGPGHNVLTGRYACYGVYGTAGGGWLAVGAIEPVFWANLCRALGLERWIDHQCDDDAQDAIRADLRQVLAGRTRDEWVALLADADTCVAPVLDIAEVVADAHFTARGAFVEATLPDRPPFRQLGPMLAGTARRQGYELRDPAVTDTVDLLAAAGLPPEEIDTLLAEGAIA